MLIIGALTVGASLAAAAPAGAKGYIRAIRVCGPAACVTANGPPAATHRFGMDMLAGNVATTEPPPVGPYYRLTFRPRYELPDAEVFYVPGADETCADGECIRVPAGLSSALAEAAAQVDPFRPVIRSVTVNDRLRHDPGAYAALFDALPPAAPPSAVGKSRAYPIEIHFTRITPWSVGGVSWMAYYPRYRALTRAGTWVRVGDALDRQIRTGSAITRSTSGGTRRWPIAAAAMVAIAAAAGAGRRLRRPGAA
jgi:hypothetical protein